MTQNDWDKMLVSTFYENPDVPMWRLFSDIAEIEKLKRTPSLLMMHMTVMRFVCVCLPKLATVLWKATVKDADRIANVLGRSSIDTTGMPEIEHNKMMR